MLVVVQVAGEEKSLASSGTGPWPASPGLAWIVTNSFGGGKCSSLKLVAQSGLASASGRLGASHMVRNLTILDVGKKMPNPELMEKKGRGVQSCE